MTHNYEAPDILLRCVIIRGMAVLRLKNDMILGAVKVKGALLLKIRNQPSHAVLYGELGTTSKSAAAVTFIKFGDHGHAERTSVIHGHERLRTILQCNFISNQFAYIKLFSLYELK